MKSHNAAIFCFLLLLSLTGCRSSEEPVSTSTKDENSFFPLKTGNKWYYRDYQVGDSANVLAHTSLTWEVKESKILGDKKFYLVEETDFDNRGNVSFVDTNYYCVKNDSLFCITDNHPSADSYIEFRGCFSYDTGTFIVVPYGSRNLMGHLSDKNDSQVTFHYYLEASSAYEYDLPSWRTTFEKGVGMAEKVVVWSGFGKKLVRHELK